MATQFGVLDAVLHPIAVAEVPAQQATTDTGDEPEAAGVLRGVIRQGEADQDDPRPQEVDGRHAGRSVAAPNRAGDVLQVLLYRIGRGHGGLLGWV